MKWKKLEIASVWILLGHQSTVLTPVFSLSFYFMPTSRPRLRCKITRISHIFLFEKTRQQEAKRIMVKTFRVATLAKWWKWMNFFPKNYGKLFWGRRSQQSSAFHPITQFFLVARSAQKLWKFPFALFLDTFLLKSNYYWAKLIPKIINLRCTVQKITKTTQEIDLSSPSTSFLW